MPAWQDMGDRLGHDLALFGASGVFFCSGGYKMYKMRGVAARQTSPGTRPARAQVPQLMVDPRASLARSTARGLAAMAVMNIADEIVVVWKQVSIKYDPIFFSVLSAGSLPQAKQRAFARGKNIPPARAATYSEWTEVGSSRCQVGTLLSNASSFQDAAHVTDARLGSSDPNCCC